MTPRYLLALSVELGAYNDADAEHLARVIESRLADLLPPTSTVTREGVARIPEGLS